MEINIETSGFRAYISYGRTEADIHMRDRSILTSHYYPKSDTCHEFVAVTITTPSLVNEEPPTDVNMHLSVADARRLMDEIAKVLADAEAT